MEGKDSLLPKVPANEMAFPQLPLNSHRLTIHVAFHGISFLTK